MATVHTALPDLPITRALASSWWLVLLRGLVGVAFGVAALVWPGITLFALVLLWGAYALVDGILSLAAAIKNRGAVGKTWWLVFAGIVGLAAGILAFVWPGITSWALVMLIGAWAFVHGIFEIVGAIRLRREIDNEWSLAIAGVLSTIVGLGIMIFPGAGALALVWIIAFYAIIFGISLVFLAFRLRSRGLAEAA